MRGTPHPSRSDMSSDADDSGSRANATRSHAAPPLTTPVVDVPAPSPRASFSTSAAANALSAAHYSPNVRTTLWYTVLDGACYSLWGMQLLPIFLLEITSHTAAIGAAATTSGVAQLLGAVITGCVADRTPRQLCIRAGALCAAAALLTLICAISVTHAPLIFVGQALWGLYTGITSTSVEALFADSVPQGRRTNIYNTKWMLQTICYVVGYLAGVVLFGLWQNDWSVGQMRAVLLLGLGLHPVALLPLWWLSDRHALMNEDGEEEVGEGAAEGEGGEEGQAGNGEAGQEETAHAALSVLHTTAAPAVVDTSAIQQQLRRPIVGGTVHQQQQQQQHLLALPRQRSTSELLRQTSTPSSSSVDASASNSDGGESGAVSCARLCTLRLCTRSGGTSLVSLAMVPYWMCAVDLLLAIGSGMSLPFFGLYFKARGIQPVGLYGIYIASTVFTAATSSVLPWLIGTCNAGRIPAVIAVRVVGTAALLLLATAHHDSVLHGVSATVALFLCRNALMNAVFGVTRSVIMDCVRKENRAKWSAFESVTSLSWAGSAALGGLITEAHSYEMNFTITAVVQLVATLLMLPAAVGAWELDRAASSSAPADATNITVAEEEEEERPPSV